MLIIIIFHYIKKPHKTFFKNYSNFRLFRNCQNKKEKILLNKKISYNILIQLSFFKEKKLFSFLLKIIPFIFDLQPLLSFHSKQWQLKILKAIHLMMNNHILRQIQPLSLRVRDLLGIKMALKMMNKKILRLVKEN